MTIEASRSGSRSRRRPLRKKADDADDALVVGMCVCESLRDETGIRGVANGNKPA